jgi:hypothetical protein
MAVVGRKSTVAGGALFGPRIAWERNPDVLHTFYGLKEVPRMMIELVDDLDTLSTLRVHHTA